MSLPQHATDHLATEQLVIDAGLAIPTAADNGTLDKACAEYDRLSALENESYEAMNAKGLSRAQWSEFDRRRRAMYKAAGK